MERAPELASTYEPLSPSIASTKDAAPPTTSPPYLPAPKRNMKPCGRCSFMQKKCDISPPHSSERCKECTKAGIPACPPHNKRRETGSQQRLRIPHLKGFDHIVETTIEGTFIQVLPAHEGGTWSVAATGPVAGPFREHEHTYQAPELDLGSSLNHSSTEPQCFADYTVQEDHMGVFNAEHSLDKWDSMWAPEYSEN
ncbi:hypothetical protein DFH11DRAFT_1544406 [Phellopilus nigrolimitatus]|nr:hypothetical protein DFH11DRAFT_1544406 [Phellopilus nigrolimitatus]